MTARLALAGRLPGLNDYTAAERGNRQAAAKLKREVEAQIMWQAKAQLRGVKFRGKVCMHYLWIERDRRRDKDNIAFAKKFVQDALVKAKILRGDGWNEVDGFSDNFAVDAKNPRVEITITEVGP